MKGMTTDRQRLDQLLVARNHFETRSRARDAIARGTVCVDGVRVTRPGQPVGPEAAITIDDPARGYVSRAALKLAPALDHFALSVTGLHALDIGASTGGFTQVLLERGAARSVALDVGIDQLADILRNDPRVIVMEGVNARDLEADDLPYAPDLIVSDVSFISLRLVLPPVLKLAASGARGVFLFKPQFEVGRDGLGKGGIVRGDADVEGALAAVLDVIRDAGWQIDAVCDAPIAGGDGNRERLIAASASTPPHA